jgi:hypothetical protein
MKWIRSIFQKEDKKGKSVDKKEESFMKFGREQFKTLAKKGLSVPVVLL